MEVGDLVKFTGHGYRRAIEYRYADIFGDKIYKVKETRRSCCNTFLMLEGVEGMYCDVFFTKITELDTPAPLYPLSKRGRNNAGDSGQDRAGSRVRKNKKMEDRNEDTKSTK